MALMFYCFGFKQKLHKSATKIQNADKKSGHKKGPPDCRGAFL
jgi:hypothetical protein